MARPGPEQHPPPVQRLRIRYAKRGRARFTSHRDFGRAFERALRRAGIPMAYSSGYSPHPRISYANASPTGAATEAEYLEIGVIERCDPERVRVALDAALPDGLVIMTVVEAGPGSLAERLTGSVWRVDLPAVDPVVARTAVATFLGQSEVAVQRLTKNGLRTFDARPAVVELAVESLPATELGESPAPPVPDPVAGCRLRLVMEHQTPLVRPDDVLSALAVATTDPPVITRLSQGELSGTEVSDPLADAPA